MIRNILSKLVSLLLMMGIIVITSIIIIQTLNKEENVSNINSSSHSPIVLKGEQKEDFKRIQLILADEEVNDLSERDIEVQLDLNEDGHIDYSLLINGKLKRKCTPSVTKREVQEHQYMKEYNYIINLSQDYGQIILTLYDVINSGLVYYMEYVPNSITSKELTFEIKANKTNGLNILEGYYEGKILKFNHRITRTSIPLPNIVNYIDGENNHIRLGRVFHEKDIGRTVKSTMKIKQDISVEINESTMYHYTLPVEEGYSTKVEGMLSLTDLVKDKDVQFNIATLSVMDLADEKYVWTDGVYYENPQLYEPFAENDFFRTPSALHIRACYWVLNEGSFYSTYAISLMYAYVNLYNEKKYIPTKPRSGWLYEEYGIEENFYDTRFNTDTISSLLHMQEVYPDDEVKSVIDSYFEFFVDYVKNNSFYINNNLFVADYMNNNGNNELPHCSLNHFLSEMTVLYRYYLLDRNEQIFALAEVFLNSIANTYKQWIKSNGDLYYCITKDGEYLKDDYPLVTYNDLKRGMYYLEKIYGEAPKWYLEIKKSKEEWARKNGYLH